LRLGADRVPALDGCSGALDALGRRPEGKRIADQDRRDPPRGDGAGRVAVERFAERFFAGRKGEGMEERNAALETLLRFRRAGICKGDSAEFFAPGPAIGAATAWLAVSAPNGDRRTSINERNRAPRIASLRSPLVDISKSGLCRL